MEASFWMESWNQGGTATSFHRRDIHPYVMRYLNPEVLKGKRVLVPLCGKTNDMMWFREHAAEVIGIELVPKAIEQFFAEQELSYAEVEPGRFVSENLTILNMDMFAVTEAQVGRIDVVYDRAALVALPYEMRMRYVATLDALLPIGAEQLVITLDYKPTMDTPPFSITAEEVEAYYGERYAIAHVESPTLPEHRMVAKFNLEYLIEHGFWLSRQR